MERPTYNELAKWSLAALSNARRLYADAVALLESGRTPSAMILVGLAADELGKHIMIAALPSRAASDEEWEKFQRRMNGHVHKLGNSLLASWILDLFSFDGPPDPKEFHRLRLAATYVDFHEGALQSPTEVVDVDTVVRKADEIRRILEYCESHLHGADAAQIGAAMTRVHASKKTAANPEAAWTRAYTIATMNGIPKSDAERFASLLAKFGSDTTPRKPA